MSSVSASNRRSIVEAPIDVSDVEALIDRFGPVRLTVLGLPSQARLTAGRLNYDGSWTVRAGELAGLAVRAPKDLPEFDIELVPELEPSVGAAVQGESTALATQEPDGDEPDDWDASRPADPQSWIDARREPGRASAQGDDTAQGGGWVAALDG